MRTYAEENKLLSQPRRTLIGSYHGKKILLATPLLKWYLEHGLEVTKIYMVVEYKPNACFQKFGDFVSDSRRQGDQDPDKAILAESAKLLGNSAYGKTITNLLKYCDLKYASAKESQDFVKSPHFRKMTQLTEDLYEIELTKATVNWNLPIQIGFFVYQYAKLRMLQFHYDFLDT